MIAYRVHEARDPAAVLGDARDGFLGEEAEVARAGDPEPGPDIVADLLGCEGRDAAAEPDSLLELAELGQIEPGPELGLADEEDLQSLLARRLEVGEEPDLLERAVDRGPGPRPG